MGKIRDLIKGRKRRERKLENELRPSKRKAKRAVKRAAYLYRDTRDDIRARRRDGEVVLPTMIEQRDGLLEQLLAARKVLDRAEDRNAGMRARIARGARKLKRARKERAAGETISRAEWGAAAPRGGLLSQIANLVWRIQHHDAYPMLPASASVAEESAHMRRIQQGHFARGMTDIAYTSVTFASGRTYQGRDPSKVGAGALGYNTGYLHKCMQGNFENDRPTVKAIEGQRAAWEALPQARGLPLKGHHQVNATACPGSNLKPKLSTL